jgi:hypothetical protein
MAGGVGLESAGPAARHRKRLATLLGSALLALYACKGERLVLTSGDAGVPTAEAEGEEPMLDPTVTNMPGSPSVAVACPTDLPRRRARDDCWPTRYVGAWSGFLVGDPQYEARDGSLESFPVGEIEVRLSTDGTGTLIFVGASAPPAPPSAAADPYLCAGATPMTGCPEARRLVEGFTYHLENLTMFDASIESAPRIGEQPLRVGERFRFDISLGEPWRAWCDVQLPDVRACSCLGCESEICFGLGLAPGVANEAACEASPGSAECGWLTARAAEPCACRSDGCVARERALAILLQMSEDGLALRGEYLPSRGDLRPGRLEFSRVE